MTGPLNADQPIKDSEDDLIGVAPFAHALGELQHRPIVRVLEKVGEQAARNHQRRTQRM